MSDLTWNQLKAIEREHGDAFFVIDLEVFRSNYHELRDAIRSYYPNANLAYSYKTNYLPRFCRLVNEWGGYAEVVSGMEYEMALRADVPPEKIIVNGPYRPGDVLERTLNDGARINIDSPYQIDALVEMSLRRPVQVGVRCNFDIGRDRVSRFGFDAHGSELGDAVRRLRAIRDVEVVGLHCHYPLPGRSAKAYADVVRRMAHIAKSLFPDSRPQFIDIGGGYFSKMAPSLAQQFHVDVPSFDDYACAIGPAMATAFPGGEPQLIMEPGVSVTANAGKLVTRVLDVRPIRGTWFAQVSTSVQTVKPTMNPLNLPVNVVRGPRPRPPSPDKPVDVVGYTCMENDIMYRGLEADVAAGDYLIFDNCGAYTNVQKMPFIRAAPAMLTVNERGKVDEVLRRAESTDDVLITYAR